MSDYIKELEQQIEEMHAKLAKSDAANAELKYLVDLRDGENGEICRHVLTLKEELKNMKNSYEHACGIVADMHKAAMGKVCAPRGGPIEDVAKLRSMYLKLKEKKHVKRINRPIRKTTGRTHRVPPKAAR